jgi:hypothetical protein
MAEQQQIYVKVKAGGEFPEGRYEQALKERFPGESDEYIRSMASFMTERKDVADRFIFKGPADYTLTVYLDRSYEIRDRRGQIRASGGPASYETEGYRRTLKTLGIEDVRE